MINRHYIIASHDSLSCGMKQTIEFLFGKIENLHIIEAYKDNKKIDDVVSSLVDNIPSDDELIIFTDLLSGSVNQKFLPYINKQHIHLVAGVNLSIVMAMLLENRESYLKNSQINKLIEEARLQLVYVNELVIREDEDDE